MQIKKRAKSVKFGKRKEEQKEAVEPKTTTDEPMKAQEDKAE